MANRKRAEARRKAQAKSARTSGEGGASKGLMWAAIAVLIAVAAGIGIFAASGDDEAASGTETTQAGSKLPDSQPVTVTGEPLVPLTDGAADAAVGVDAPIISGLNFGGDEIVLDAKATGRPYMVVFLAHWCPHCNAEVPRLNDWKHSGAVPAELDVIGVATAVSETAANYPPSNWFSNRGWEWPVMVDEADGDGAAGKAAQAFGATGWPYFVIVGADGKVKARGSGEKEVSELEAIVDAALAS